MQVRKMLAGRSPSPRVRSAIRFALRPLPTRALVTFCARGGVVGKVAGQGLRGREATIADGPGSGLLIDVGGSNPAYATGTNESPVQAAFPELLAPGGVLFDVGANIGFFSLIGGRIVGHEGTVVAFEPGPDNLPVLRANAARNGMDNVVVEPLAVSDRDGTAELALAEYSGGHSLVADSVVPVDTITVTTITLDTFVGDGGTPAPDVVKIDVEGAELAVLRGMVGLLTDCGPAVVLELDAATRQEHDDRLRMVQSFLARFGYGMRQLDPSYPGEWVVSHWVCQAKRGR